MASNSVDQDSDLIRITHYINPHNFWFKQESAFLFNADEQRFQLELHEYCENTFGRGNINTGIFTPRKAGELVAVFHFQLARWIRAEVDEIQHELNGQVQCNLWAIDEGVPVKTSCRYIKPLPEKFAKVSTNVKHGGLEGVLPAESGYDYLEGCTMTKMVEDWSPGIVRVFESCIEEAVSISFCKLRHYQVVGFDMYFGTMKITSHQNVTNNAIDLLRKAGGKMILLVGQTEFYDKFPLLRSQDMQRFEDNERRENMKYHTNTFRPEYSSRSTPHVREKSRVRDDFIIKQAREKFLEWDKRNTASSTVNAPLSDFLEVQEPIVPNSIIVSTSKGKGWQNHELSYTELVNESVSDDDDDEEPPKIELGKLTPMNHPKAYVLNNNQETISNACPAYQQLQGRTYDKNVSDIAPALHKIKLRRQAAIATQQPTKNTTVNSSKFTSSALNIMPAGFSLGNVDFADGSVVLGGKNDGSEKKKVTSIFDNGRTYSKVRSQRGRKPYFDQQRDEQNSSGEEEIVRKLTITAVRAGDDDDEQW